MYPVRTRSWQDNQEKVSGQLTDERPRVVIVGCGQSGCNTIHRLFTLTVPGAKLVSIHADKTHLTYIRADTRILIGKSLFQGNRDNNYDLGRDAVKKARPILKELFKSGDLVFIISGLDGGVGRGYPPVVAKIAKDMGATVISILSHGYKTFSGRKTLYEVRKSVEELENISKSLLLIDRYQLMDHVPVKKDGDEFGTLDLFLSEAITGIIDTLTLSSLKKINSHDFLSVLEKAGAIRIVIGEGLIHDHAETIVDTCFSESLNNSFFPDATGVFILISGGSDLQSSYCDDIISSVAKKFKPQTPIISGARIREEMGEKIYLMIITQIPEPYFTGEFHGWNIRLGDTVINWEE